MCNASKYYVLFRAVAVGMQKWAWQRSRYCAIFAALSKTAKFPSKKQSKTS